MMKAVCYFLILAIVCTFLATADGKKNSKSKTAKDETIDKGNSETSNSNDDKDTNEIKQPIKQTSLPAVAVEQTSLPAATKESDKGVSLTGHAPDRVDDDDSASGSGQADNADENVNKPINVKSKNTYENDNRKFAESVKKSTQVKVDSNKKQSNGKSTKKLKTEKQKNSEVSKKSKEPKSSIRQDNKSKQSSGKKESQKRNKPGHHHHHHHHHNHDKKTKRPVADNEANKPKKDYPVFDWKKFGDRVKNSTARIPGWSGGPQASVAQLLALSQMAPAAIPRDMITWPVERFMNGTISNQADIASIDKASTEPTEQSAQKDKAVNGSSDSQPSQQDASTAEKTNSSSSNTDIKPENSASDSDNKNPVAQTVESDTGEVPHTISKTADVKIPDSIPARCAGLVKSYSNGEYTLVDYLKQLKKCKRADSDFNSAHPFTSNGNLMLRNSISKNGAYLTKEAYKYALERMRNYVPSTKEKQEAEQILAKWRSNSFGNRESASANGDVPDAVKSFMTGQGTEAEAKAVKKQNIQAQTEEAINQANHFILGTITGRTGDFPANSNNVKKSDITASNTEAKTASLLTNPNQSITKVIEAAQALISGDKSGQALVLTPGGKAAVVPLAASVSKKQTIPAPTLVQKKTMALKMAKVADKLNDALLSQISPNPVTKSDKVSTSLLAALKNMAAPGPETQTASIADKALVQKRSINANSGGRSKRKRRGLSTTLIYKHVKSYVKKRHMRKRRELGSMQTENDNPSERSKMNKPIIPAPKLMDKIRDMSMVIATP